MAYISPRETFDRWLDERLMRLAPEAVESVRAACDAYDRIVERGRIEEGDLQRIVEVARDARRACWENAVDLLEVLTAEYPKAQDAVRAMATDGKAHVRFAALCCLGRQTPASFARELLREALHDRSAKVRRKAASQAFQLRLTSMIDELQSALERERDVATIRELALCLPLLRDGYHIEEKGEQVLVTVALQPGGICGGFVNHEEFAGRGVEEIMRDVRARGSLGSASVSRNSG